MKALTQQSSTFRIEEAHRLYKWIEAGASGLVLGVSGVGKSNLFHHLQQERIVQTGTDGEGLDQGLGQGLSQEMQNVLVHVNFHFAPDFSERSIFSVILSAIQHLPSKEQGGPLEPATSAAIRVEHERLLAGGNDRLRSLQAFREAIHLVMSGERERRLVLILDQFDDVYRQAPSRLFAMLRALRDSYKYRLSYFIFVRDELENLADSSGDREEFAELFLSNKLGLKPYNERDSQALLQRLARRHGRSFDPEHGRHLFKLTGGHAGLLKAAFLDLHLGERVQGQTVEERIEGALAVPAIRQECYKLWRSLPTDEKKLLATLVRALPLDEGDRDAARKLAIKGILTSATEGTVFSPLFERYIHGQESPWDQDLYVDGASREVWVFGRRTESLSPLEFEILKTLYERAGEVVSRDDLVEEAWQSDPDGPYDTSITSAIYRLRRKVEPDPSNPRFIEVLRKKGYRLNLE